MHNCAISAVLVNVQTGECGVVLEDLALKRIMVAPIGYNEACQVAEHLRGVMLIRPTAHCVFNKLLERQGGRVLSIILDRKIPFPQSRGAGACAATMKVLAEGKEHELDVRISDALCWAMINGIPFLVTDDIFDADSVAIEPGKAIDSQLDNTSFKGFKQFIKEEGDGPQP